MFIKGAPNRKVLGAVGRKYVQRPFAGFVRRVERLRRAVINSKARNDVRIAGTELNSRRIDDESPTCLGGLI